MTNIDFDSTTELNEDSFQSFSKVVVQNYNYKHSIIPARWALYIIINTLNNSYKDKINN